MKKGPIRLPPEQIAQFKKDCLGGMSNRKLAGKYKAARTTIVYWRDYYKLPPAQGHKKIDVDKLEKYLKAGLTEVEISKRLGCSIFTVGMYRCKLRYFKDRLGPRTASMDFLLKVQKGPVLMLNKNNERSVYQRLRVRGFDLRMIVVDRKCIVYVPGQEEGVYNIIHEILGDSNRLLGFRRMLGLVPAELPRSLSEESITKLMDRKDHFKRRVVILREDRNRRMKIREMKAKRNKLLAEIKVLKDAERKLRGL